ncbi:MAG: GxGYxYP family putative glycoside hydrolase [Candidatus Marsarchaeota archaeon]
MLGEVRALFLLALFLSGTSALVEAVVPSVPNNGLPAYYALPPEAPPPARSLSFINLSYVKAYAPAFLNNVSWYDFWEAGNVSRPSFIPGLYFPVFPRAKTVYVVNLVGYYPSDEDVLLAAVSAQGIENRYDPDIYLEYSGDAVYQYNLSSYAHLVFYNGSDPLSFVISLAKPHLKGIVVYDPSVPDTKNLATTISGLGNLVMASPSLVPELEALGLKVVVNLNKLVQEYHWNNSEAGRVAMYQWAYQYLWPYCDHLIIGVENPGAAVSSPPETASIASRDYVVSLKLICLYLHANATAYPEEYALYSEFLSTAPHPIPIFGWVNNEEWPTVSLASKYGDWVSVIAHFYGPLNFQDLTVFSSIMVPPEVYAPKISREAVLETLNPGVFLALYASDGDNMQYDAASLYKYLADLNGLPVGFTVNPNLLNVAPVIWNYYVSALRGNTTLVSSLSGSGYWYPGDSSIQDVGLYLNYTRDLLNLTGLRTMEVDGWSDLDTPIYFEKLGGAGLVLGLFRGYGGVHNLNTVYYYRSPLPVDQNNFDYGWNERGQPATESWESQNWTSPVIYGSVESLIDTVSGALRSPPPPAEFGLYPAAQSPSGHFGNVISDPTALSGHAVESNPSSGPEGQAMVYGPYVPLPQGSYTVIYHLKLDHPLSLPNSTVIATIDVDWDTGLKLVANRSLTLAQFTPGKWQNFTLSFTLNQSVPNAEFRVWSGKEGTTNPKVVGLECDYRMVLMSRQERESTEQGIYLNGTYFGTVFLLGWEIAPQTAPEVEQLMDNHEGIFLLTTDEYMAALNPIYMENLAHQEVASVGDPAESVELLAKSENALSEGNYSGSLQLSREAMSTALASSYELKLLPSSGKLEAKLTSTRGLNVSCQPIFLYVHEKGGSVYVVTANTNHLGVAEFVLPSGVSGEAIAYYYGVPSNALSYVSAVAPSGAEVYGGLVVAVAVVSAAFIVLKRWKRKGSQLLAKTRSAYPLGGFVSSSSPDFLTGFALRRRT